MSGLFLLFILGAVCYFGWFFGRLQEAEVDYKQEQLDMAAYSWAVANDRLPSTTYLIDAETGEILEEHTA
jgi:uncharacterized membrane protein YkoI